MNGPAARPRWRSLASPTAVADALCSLYEDRGGDAYDESVTQTTHAVQCAVLAEEAGAPAPVVAAALLHDVGHLLGGVDLHRSHGADRDLRHEVVGARFLAVWFGPEVVEPVALHVEAKRYLCRIDPGYASDLSPASRGSLRLQGGPMGESEAADWPARRHAEAAVALRRWDDLAKDPNRTVTSIRGYEPLLAALARRR